MDAESNGQWRGYGANKDLMPLGGYAALMGGYNLALAGFLIWAGGRRRRLIPERFRAGDLLLLGVATHKLTRLIGKDFVTSPLRAPFVEFKGSSIAGEVTEKSRGRGLRRAIGDLLTCEFCLAPWVAGALFGGYALHAPATRFV